MSLQIIQAKPNPTGKAGEEDQDGLGSRCGNRQFSTSVLLGEWVDVKNTGQDAVNFQDIQLRHAFFGEDCRGTAELELYWIGENNSYVLKPGQILRIHGGHREDAHLMSADDQAGADWHGYTESDNFILNNLCGDKIVLSWQDTGNQIQQDWACFAPNPPKDLILKRSGNLLAQTQIHDNGPRGCPPRFEAIPHDAIENTLKHFDVRNPNAANNLTRSEWAKLTWTKVDANNRQEAAELCLAGWMREDEDDCEFGSEEYIVYVRDEVGHIFKCDVRMTKTVIYQCLLDKPITG